MVKTFSAILILLTASSLIAAPFATEKSADAQSRQDRIDEQARRIAAMTGYSLRLQGMLARAGAEVPPGDAGTSLQDKMARVLPRIHCESVGLSAALAALSRKAALPMKVDWKALEDAGIDRNAPVTCDVPHCTVQAALNAILDSAGIGSGKLAFLLEDGTVKVTTADWAARHVFTKTFDVSGLRPGGMTNHEFSEAIAELISSTVAPDSWQDNGGESGKIDFSGSQIVVKQTAANLLAIENLLDQLSPHNEAAHDHATIAAQQERIAKLAMEIDKLRDTCRSLSLSVPPPVEEAIRQPFPDAQFIGKPLYECFNVLRAESGQIITVNWDALTAAGIGPDNKITLSLHGQTLAEAIQAIFPRASENKSLLGVELQNGVIVISTQDQFDRAELVTRTYDIRGVWSRGKTREEAVETLVRALTDKIEPESWVDAGGTFGHIRELQGILIVTQTPRAQKRIEGTLNSWRQGRNLPSTREEN